jgi:hypothetical protein
MQKISTKTFGMRRLCSKDKQIKSALGVRKMKEEINECNIRKAKEKRRIIFERRPRIYGNI